MGSLEAPRHYLAIMDFILPLREPGRMLFSKD
jgi:hypothetical protein